MTTPMPARKPPAADATLAALYKSVLAAPNDDLPRLVYADRLDELGDHPRADFIRLQIHVANTDPWDEGHADALVKNEVLYERHKEGWGIAELTRDLMRSKGVTPGVFNPFVRGFPEITWANIETFSAAHRKALKKYPIRELVLVGTPLTSLGRVGRIINEVKPRALDLSSASAAAFASLSWGNSLPSVRKLIVRIDLDMPTEQVEWFAACGNFPNVEVLEFSGQVVEERLLALIRELRWPKLCNIHLNGRFTPRVVDALAAANWAEQVRTLSLAHDLSADVDYATEPAAPLAPLLWSTRLTNLRSLSVENFPVPLSVEQALATSTLTPLDHFAIDGWCDPPVSDYPALLSSPALAVVKSLDLPGSDMSAAAVVEQLGRNQELRHLKWETFEIAPETWAALAGSPLTQTLRRLQLERAELNGEAVRVLLAGRPWPHLAELVVKYWKCDGRAVAKLIDHPHFARLSHLDLPGGPSAAHLWKALAKSKTVGRFHKLRLGFAITDAQLNALLDNPEVCKIGHLALPTRVKVSAKTRRRYEKVFGVRITRDW